jgi:hypothetical protein
MLEECGCLVYCFVWGMLLCLSTLFAYFLCQMIGVVDSVEARKEFKKLNLVTICLNFVSAQ